MPLQVIFSTSSRPPEPITLVSAGDDQFTFCGEEITLQAVLIGPEFGHTFLWEQVSDKKEFARQFKFLSWGGVAVAVTALAVFMLPENKMPL